MVVVWYILTMSDNSVEHEPGKFIAFEGIDGSGKSTQIGLLLARLANLGVRCSAAKEPSNLPVGSLVRQILAGGIKTDERVLANLFAADRIDHLLNEAGGIYNKIQDGITVITDRYYFSSYAYNTVNTGLDMDWVINVNAVSSGILRPTVTIFLDVAPELAMRRIKRRAGQGGRELFEEEWRLALVREKYFEAFARLKDTENVAVIDAGGGEDTVEERVWAEAAKYF